MGSAAFQVFIFVTILLAVYAENTDGYAPRRNGCTHLGKCKVICRNITHVNPDGVIPEVRIRMSKENIVQITHKNKTKQF